MATQNWSGFWKKKEGVSRVTSSNYTDFTKLGKNKVGFTTSNIIKSVSGKPMVFENVFEATGTPVQKFINAVNKSQVENLGKLGAKYFNITPEYRKLLENGKGQNKMASVGFDKPQVKSGANVTRIHDSTRGATAQDIVEFGNQKDIEEWGSKFGKFGKEVRKALEEKYGSSEKDSEQEQKLGEQLSKVKEKHGKKISSGLKGVSNIFGSFMEAFRRN